MAMSPRLLRPLASGFNPRSISGLALWLDAADGSTLFQNSDGTTPATATSDPVGYWGDKSGNGRHATQATAASRPTISATTQNGRRTLGFDGTNDTFAAFTSDLQPSSIFAVVNCSSSGAFPSGRAIIGNDTSDRPLAWIEEDRWEFVRWGQNMSGPVAADLSTNILSATNDGTTSTLFVNGGGAVTDAGGTFSSGALTIGAATDSQYFAGFMAELLVYDRALTATERRRVELHLSRKWGITLAPQVSNADAQDWVNRVYANGGAVSQSTASAVSTMCDAIESAGIRDRFYRLNLFCGSNLNAALVPLYRGPTFGGTTYGNATDTNNGPFVSGDYVETGASGGLKGNGSSKYLDTGLAGDTFSAGDRHCSAYWNANATITGSRAFIGNTDSSSNSAWMDVHSRFASDGSAAQITNNYGLTHTAANRHQLVQYDGATSASSYSDGGDKQTRTAFPLGAPTASVSNWYVFGINPSLFGGLRTDARICTYSIGLSMTDANALAFYNAVHAFQTALGRNA